MGKRGLRRGGSEGSMAGLMILLMILLMMKRHSGMAIARPNVVSEMSRIMMSRVKFTVVPARRRRSWR